MLAQAPHLCSYFLTKLGFSEQSSFQKLFGKGAVLHLSGQGAPLALLPAQ